MRTFSNIVVALFCFVASALPLSAVSAAPLSAGIETQVEQKVSACQKLTATIPAQKKCGGASGHISSAVRTVPGNSGCDETACVNPVRLSTAYRRSSDRTLRYVTYPRARRSPFWRVFAISSRLRN